MKVVFEQDELWFANPMLVFTAVNFVWRIGRTIIVKVISLNSVKLAYYDDIVAITAGICALEVIYLTRKQKLKGGVLDKLVLALAVVICVGFMALNFFHFLVSSPFGLR
jgi:hypothetical protein